jgi:hypothetical protein
MSFADETRSRLDSDWVPDGWDLAEVPEPWVAVPERPRTCRTLIRRCWLAWLQGYQYIEWPYWC